MAVADSSRKLPWVEVIIEVPKGSFIKRSSAGKIDFISPVPCPFNYGSVPAFIGRDGDFLDIVVLGPRLAAGTKLTIPARAAVSMIDHGFHDDKLIGSGTEISPVQRRFILLFFWLYAKAKTLINLAKGLKGRNSCEGWRDARFCLERAKAISAPPPQLQ